MSARRVETKVRIPGYIAGPSHLQWFPRSNEDGDDLVRDTEKTAGLDPVQQRMFKKIQKRLQNVRVWHAAETLPKVGVPIPAGVADVQFDSVVDPLLEIANLALEFGWVLYSDHVVLKGAHGLEAARE